jgi:hypothetical protein
MVPAIVIVGSSAWVVVRGSVVAPRYAALAALWLSTGAFVALTPIEQHGFQENGHLLCRKFATLILIRFWRDLCAPRSVAKAVVRQKYFDPDAAIHIPLQSLEPVDLPFDLATQPFRRQPVPSSG